jgi:arylsulfatase A-like enzyme/Flp pilus assembly protein TadD
MCRYLWPREDGKEVGMRRYLVGALVAGLLVVLGWHLVPRQQQPLNLILISIDTLRADHLGCYGHDRIGTPNIDAFAGRSLRFERCFSAVPITLPSHTTMLTGMYPLRHSVRDNGTFVVPEDTPTLATILKHRGYRTMGVIGAYPLHSRFGLSRGFDIWDEELNQRYERIMTLFFDERKADKVTRRALDLLSGDLPEPFFLFLHYFDPHHPWNPPSFYLQQHQDLPYDAEITFVDAWLGRLFARLEEQGLMERSLVILTADHGEGLGEHGEETHSFLLYNGTMHVPLILSYPGVTPGTVDRIVSLADIVPTVLELLGIELEHDIDGVSLLQPAPAGRQLYMEALSGRLERGWNDLRALVTGEGTKYLLAYQPELYDLDQDAGERVNLAPDQPETVRVMDEALHRLITTGQGRHSLAQRYSLADAEVTRKLRALGYLTGDGSGDLGELGPITAAGDPRRHVELIWVQSVARNLISLGELHQAVSLLENTLEVVDDDELLRHLVLAYLLAQNHEQALRLGQELLARCDEHDSAPLVLLAGAQRGLGNTTEALELLDHALAIDPDPEVMLQKADLLEEMGRSEAAVACLHELLQSESCQRRARIELARLLRGLGRSDEMVESYRRMLQCDSRDPLPMYNLGSFDLEQGNREGAARWFEMAVAAEPSYAPAHFGLALVHHENGDREQAVAELRAALAAAPLNSAIGRKASALLSRLEAEGGSR